MRKSLHFAAALATAALLCPALAAAQDLGDYEGSRASTVQEDLRARGYNRAGDKRGYSLWLKRSSSTCIGISVDDEMVTDAQYFGARDCQGSGSGGGGTGAAVAGVAVAALIGAALLSHHDKHYKEGRSPQGNDDTAQFERGFRDGRNGSESYNYEHNTSYNDGWNAGHRERSNQMEASQHHYEVMRQPRSGAPSAARAACAREADSYWNIPAGSAVATDSYSEDRDVWVVTVQSGYDSARCRVNGRGNVEGIDED